MPRGQIISDVQLILWATVAKAQLISIRPPSVRRPYNHPKTARQSEARALVVRKAGARMHTSALIGDRVWA